MKKPSVNLSPVAEHYSADDERIVELSSEVGGGLMLLKVVNGRLTVLLYRLDETVDVTVSEAQRLPVR